ncbi:MAG: diphthine synthase [Candidatus Altiarchaeales archaeon]|nr:MAG: diphthine synthase [Candidatus Altiarchaeales archaeon]
MLYLIGLGIYDEKDISLKGLETLRNCDELYAEFYTNVFSGDLKNLESLVKKKIKILRRSDIEENPEENVLKNSLKKKVALLVSGDPMVATTHIDLILRAKKLGIGYKIIHASSVYSAIGETGLQIYKFGRTSTLAFPEKGYFPTTPYDVLKENLKAGLHTLLLLDVRSEKERFMTVNEGIDLLLKMEEMKKEKIFNEDSLCMGIARLGNDTKIKVGKAKELLNEDFGKPPHILIIPGKLHFMEEEAIEVFR